MPSLTRESGWPEVTAAPQTQTASPTATEDVVPTSFRQRHPKFALLLRSPLPLVASIVLALLLLVAVVGAPLASTAAARQDLGARFLRPFHLSHGWEFVLGSDSLGRSMLLQLLVGARTTFVVAGCAVGLSALVGVTIGMISGYRGGWVDASLMRISDVIVTVPSLLLALAVLFVLTPSITNLVLVLAISRLPVYLRLARAQTLEIRQRVFIEASHALGATGPRIVWRDIRPLVIPTVLTVGMLEVANVMLAAAGLSFLGVGLQRPNIDWGTMVSEGRQYLSEAWWVTVLPGAAILISALAANLISNWLRAAGDPLQSGLLMVAGRHDPGGEQ
jgi:peptide/nickel transport system permease protein